MTIVKKARRRLPLGWRRCDDIPRPTFCPMCGRKVRCIYQKATRAGSVYAECFRCIVHDPHGRKIRDCGDK